MSQDNQDSFLFANNHLLPGALISTKESHTPREDREASRESAYLNEAPRKSTVIGCPDAPSGSNAILSGSATSTILERVPGGLIDGASSTEPLNNSTQDDSSFHLRKIKNASPDEVIFFRSVRAFGLETALWLAAKFEWKIERPLRLLHEIGEVNSEQYASALRGLSSSPVAAAKGESYP